MAGTTTTIGGTVIRGTFPAGSAPSLRLRATSTTRVPISHQTFPKGVIGSHGFFLQTGSSSSGTHWGAVFTALAGIATAIFTGTFIVVALKSHLHDLATSGTRKPVIAKRTRSIWEYDGRQTPIPVAERDSARAVAVRLVNRAPAAELVDVVTSKKTRLWFGPKITAYPTSATVKLGDPQTFMVGLRADDWPDRDWFWGTLTFSTTNGDQFTLRGRLRMWKV